MIPVYESEDLESDSHRRKRILWILLAILALAAVIVLYPILYPPKLPYKVEWPVRDYARLCSTGKINFAPAENADHLLVVDADTGSFYDTPEFPWESFPNPAEKPEQVRYLGCLRIQSAYVGEYVYINNQGQRTGCQGFRDVMELTLYDLRTAKAAQNVFFGPSPPDQVSGCNRGKVSIPIESPVPNAWLSTQMASGVWEKPEALDPEATGLFGGDLNLPLASQLGSPEGPTPTLAPPTDVPLAPGLKGKIVFVSERDGNPDIFVMNADGTKAKNLTHSSWEEYCPTWSPDGRLIVFAAKRTRSNLDIFVMNADGSDYRRLTSNQGFISSPAWHPDGSRLIFDSTDEQGETEIFSVWLDGDGLKNLTNSPGADRSPSPSPDGKSILFETAREGFWQLYIMDEDGSNPRHLMKYPGSIYTPVWSPDGSALAFWTITDAEIWGLMLFRYNGEPLLKDPFLELTTDNLHDGLCRRPDRPLWSPDGTGLAVATKKDGNLDVYLYDLKSGIPTRLTDHPAADYEPDWLPESR